MYNTDPFSCRNLCLFKKNAIKSSPPQVTNSAHLQCCPFLHSAPRCIRVSEIITPSGLRAFVKHVLSSASARVSVKQLHKVWSSISGPLACHQTLTVELSFSVLVSMAHNLTSDDNLKTVPLERGDAAVRLHGSVHCVHSWVFNKKPKIKLISHEICGKRGKVNYYAHRASRSHSPRIIRITGPLN